MIALENHYRLWTTSNNYFGLRPINKEVKAKTVKEYANRSLNLFDLQLSIIKNTF